MTGVSSASTGKEPELELSGPPRAVAHGGSGMYWENPPFPFVRHLEAHAADIRAEAEQLELEAWDDWPEVDAYSSGWRVFPLWTRDPADHLLWTYARNARRCPRSIAVLARVPGLLRAGFSMLLPGAHVYPHNDDAPERLRCHLALWTNPRAGIRFDGKPVFWREGRCLVFDGRTMHEAANLGDRHRVVLLLDVERASAEHAVD